MLARVREFLSFASELADRSATAPAPEEGVDEISVLEEYLEAVTVYVDRGADDGTTMPVDAEAPARTERCRPYAW